MSVVNGARPLDSPPAAPRGGREGAGDVSASIIRTLTPLIVGLIMSVVGSEVADIDPSTLTACVTTVLTAAYYILVRLLEKRWPKAGFLLLLPIRPRYDRS